MPPVSATNRCPPSGVHVMDTPVVAESGTAALKLLESAVPPIPLVLTDVHMPEMNGFELLKLIKINLGTPTVIMLTSRS